MKIKAITLAVAVALATFAPSAHASGFPTVDFAAIGQAIQSYYQKAQDFVKQNEQVIALKKGYDQAVKIYNNAEKQTKAIRGTFNKGMKFYNKAASIYTSIPKSMDDLTNMGKGATNSEMGKLAKELGSMNSASFKDPFQKNSYERSFKATRAAMIATDRALENLSKSAKNMKDIAGDIDSAETLKEAQDVQNAIQVEAQAANANLVMVQAAQLQVLAALNNEENQATESSQKMLQADRDRYYKKYGGSVGSSAGVVVVVTEE
jgi:CMP-N-acetylneuraminic acid synthetase